ncbi:hypothetical protein AO379_0150 [Moraxella catarrhalis]|nr:hypothetical protein AO379_0150 [Moraxella catarrhalis]
MPQSFIVSYTPLSANHSIFNPITPKYPSLHAKAFINKIKVLISIGYISAYVYHDTYLDN